MTPEKDLAEAEKEKKDLYLQACLECRRTFTPMVYSADEIPGAEELATQKRLAALLSYRLKWEYSEMCGFVRARISLAIVRYNSLLLRGPCNKLSCTCPGHVPDVSRTCPYCPGIGPKYCFHGDTGKAPKY